MIITIGIPFLQLYKLLYMLHSIFYLCEHVHSVNTCTRYYTCVHLELRVFVCVCVCLLYSVIGAGSYIHTTSNVMSSTRHFTITLNGNCHVKRVKGQYLSYVCVVEEIVCVCCSFLMHNIHI